MIVGLRAKRCDQSNWNWSSRFDAAKCLCPDCLTIRISDLRFVSQGFLLVTVGVFGPGDSIPVIEDTPGTVDTGTTVVQEGVSEYENGTRVSKIPQINYQFYNLSISIHRGHDIASIPGMAPCPYVRVRRSC